MPSLVKRVSGRREKPSNDLSQEGQDSSPTCCGGVGMLELSRELKLPKRQGWVQMLRRPERRCHSWGLWRVSCRAEEKNKGLLMSSAFRK